MSSLTGSSISSTYDRLLSLPSGGGDTTNLRALTDGNGTTTFALQLSSAGIKSTGTLEVTGDADLNGDLDVDGTTNLDVTNVVGALTVGANTSGYDVKFYGDTNGAYMRWDQTNNQLELIGNTSSVVNLIITGATDIPIECESSDEGCAVYVKDNYSSNYAGMATFGSDGTTNDRLELRTNNLARLTVNERGTGIGTNSFVAASTNQLAIANGTSPGAHTDNQIYIGSKNSAGTGTDTLATLQLFFEEAVDATALDAVGTLTTRIPIWVNDVCYWLYLDPV